ncbi:MAG: 6,7-dimethyl-8-ribityllumazine synthase [Mariprofundales bacterium]
MSVHNPILASGIDGSNKVAAIVVARFNEHITNELLAGAKRALHAAGVADMRIVWVPGAFEIGAAAAALANNKEQQIDIIVCLGCIIRGETPHFDYVCQGVTYSLSSLAMRTNAGIGFGILTVENEEQAQERIGGKHGHKGEEAALTALEMAVTIASISNI